MATQLAGSTDFRDIETLIVPGNIHKLNEVYVTNGARMITQYHEAEINAMISANRSYIGGFREKFANAAQQGLVTMSLK